MRRLRALVSILALVVALATDPAKADLNQLERLTVHQSSHVFDHGYIRSVSADRNPLARFHDRLLGRPLTHNLILRGGDGDSLAVPTGSRLGDLSRTSRPARRFFSWKRSVFNPLCGGQALRTPNHMAM